ncbi:hypothetical protein [Nitrosococcus wardiae]|uniref:Uncharacterized protein n=1 Tax=Nitrosococcus wardiae TaxID=1814290 RepID=A0A4V1AVS0_9GAMM|nr:hypothetical protein [Nitrosococcus wardiae]QBQ54105.1 hypothetical protein E3U44_06010 [Nitrosococcus wardiae]
MSLDDGQIYKVTNLSELAALTSCDGSGGMGGCTVDRDDVPLLEATDGFYPGDMFGVVAWIRLVPMFPQTQTRLTLDFAPATGSIPAPKPPPLMCMFGPKGNPSVNNLFDVICYLQQHEGAHFEICANR